MTNTTDTDIAPDTGADDAPVLHLDDITEGSMKLVKVDGHRVCVVRTASGVHALDHACPHEGYGLTQGKLDGELLTCAWHNWKFRVSDGTCVLGEEAVQTHDVDVADDGGIRVTVRRPDPEELRPRLLDSLRRGIDQHYVGQISRDVVRLLHAGATPAEIMTVGVERGVARHDYGWGHDIASATDCLAMVDLWSGDERALPLVQGLAGIAEATRDRPERPLADAGDATATEQQFRDAIEREDLDAAQAAIRAAIARGDRPVELIAWLVGATSDHHLSYGHGAIYTQKAFELLELIGWEHADGILGHLTTSIVLGTREDTLPYMRPFVRALDRVDLPGIAIEARHVRNDWDGHDALVEVLLDGDRVAPVDAIETAIRNGAGVHRVLDAIIDAVSERLLRYDVSGEFDFHDDFGWLDITHGLTYPHAARWALESLGEPSPELIRLVFFTAFQANWTGRHEWHTEVLERASVAPLADDIATYGNELQRRAQLDGTTAFIVHAHAVKTARAATREAVRRGTTLPLDATQHFLASPKLERFVAANVTRSIDFLNGRSRRD
ncbi:MAG: Rieske (2Fe-2S) protein [Ilumatobacter sp.]